jgi:hypothetical protein
MLASSIREQFNNERLPKLVEMDNSNSRFRLMMESTLFSTDPLIQGLRSQWHRYSVGEVPDEGAAKTRPISISAYLGVRLALTLIAGAKPISDQAHCESIKHPTWVGAASGP